MNFFDGPIYRPVAGFLLTLLVFQMLRYRCLASVLGYMMAYDCQEEAFAIIITHQQYTLHQRIDHYMNGRQITTCNHQAVEIALLF